MAVSKRPLSKVLIKLSGVLAAKWERTVVLELEGAEGMKVLRRRDSLTPRL